MIVDALPLFVAVLSSRQMRALPEFEKFAIVIGVVASSSTLLRRKSTVQDFIVWFYLNLKDEVAEQPVEAERGSGEGSRWAIFSSIRLAISCSSSER
jgi:hypothetical protein